MAALDHVVFAAPNLARAVEQIAALTGVVPVPGGSHPGRGTANCLVGLGNQAYLEIIGPDPDQPVPDHERPFAIDQLDEAGVSTWAVRTRDIREAIAAARLRGHDPGDAEPMSRRSPDGGMLRWQLTPPRPDFVDGLVPFLIDWGTTPHPTARALPQLALVSWAAAHPAPQRIESLLAAVGAMMRVERSNRAALRLTVEAPNGVVVLT